METTGCDHSVHSRQTVVSTIQVVPLGTSCCGELLLGHLEMVSTLMQYSLVYDNFDINW